MRVEVWECSVCGDNIETSGNSPEECYNCGNHHPERFIWLFDLEVEDEKE